MTMRARRRDTRRQGIAEERLRLMRDLHDGARQSLPALGARIALAESLVHDSNELRQLLGEARLDLADALVAIRAAVSSHPPPSLARGGLRAALATCARQAAVPIAVTCTDDRFPARILFLEAVSFPGRAATTVPGQHLTAEVMGLVAGGPYTIVVTARNAAGQARSEPSDIVTPT
ncbi:MAG: hypothetical protein E6J41_19135 [Chloroflexi bacterium]|nr:MAG: hypothetical protein E6J41_19135 [Chloroflexota bacterium]